MNIVKFYDFNNKIYIIGELESITVENSLLKQITINLDKMNHTDFLSVDLSIIVHIVIVDKEQNIKKIFDIDSIDSYSYFDYSSKDESCKSVCIKFNESKINEEERNFLVT